MREGWQALPLGELCDVLDHKRKPITKRDREAGEYPYYGATGVLDRVAGYLFDEPLVLVGEDGAKWGSGENTAFAVEGRVWVNNHAHVLRPNRDKLLDRWLIYHLNHSDLSAFVSGLTVPKLNQGSLREIAVPLPPLPEQQRIVALLDEAFAGLATAKANAERNLHNARAIFESHLESVFSQRGEGWVERRLGDILKTGAGGTPLKSKKEYYEGGTIPWLMSGEVSQGEVTVATKFITAMGLENSSARMFPPDTVLVAMYGATAGQVGILRFEAATNQAVCGILPSDRFIPEFLFYVLLSRKGELVAQATGNAQPNISQIKIKNIEVPLIPLIEQREIVAKFIGLSQETQRLTRLYERKLAALEELKKSLLHQAFNGEL